ncbi:MAG: phosphate ABC transporter substrate-binding protein [Cyanobacteria bacterium RI_101]|nr:phosphate ABC transporter substrate-binding protein [Cyanobacteria bacterium RI_101]
MSAKNDTLPLLLALAVTGTVVGGGAWWLSGQFSSPPSAPTAGSGLQSAANVPAGRFRYGGSTTFAPIRDIADREIMRQLPQFQLIYVDPISGTPGSGKGIEMLIDNQLNLSQSSRPLKDSERKSAEAKGFKLGEIPVAIDGIAVAVNPALNLPGLTVAQLKDIYTGKIQNWREVGGPDLPLTPYSRDPKDGGTVEFFQDQVLEKEKFGANVVYVHSTTPALRKVSQDPGGIYYASAPELVPQCSVKPLPLGRKPGEWVAPYQEPYVLPAQCPQQRNSLNKAAFQEATYPITRNIFVIVKEDGGEQEQAGRAYGNLLLTQEGQRLIEQAGFVPLR